MITTGFPNRERGAALVVSLLLLLVLTVVGIVGMSTSTLELAMAGNLQYQNTAFEAADSIVEAEMTRTDIAPLVVPGPLPIVAANTGREYRDADNNVIATASATSSYEGRTGVAGWQLGGKMSFAAFHFEVDGQSDAAQNAAARHRQGFYVVGPSL